MEEVMFAANNEPARSVLRCLGLNYQHMRCKDRFFLSTCGSLLLLVSLPLSVHAGLIQEWQLKDTASAPVLIIGRILDVHGKERVPEDQLSWKAETLSMTADVEVLRSFTASGMPPASHQVQIHFLAYGPSVTGFINGYPPPLPFIRSGEVRILPLRENSNPASEPWQLTAVSGLDITIPVRADAEYDTAPPVSGRTFLIRELANTLSRGTPGEVSALSGYLSRKYEDLSGELMPLLETAIDDNRQQWAEIAASLHAGRGIPRPTVAELFEANPETSQKASPLQASLPLLQAALRKLQRSPETNDQLIRTWIANAPFNAWGSANSLAEYADSPVTTETLRQALRNDLPGSSYIAMVLANHGNNMILPDAVARAFRVTDDPAGLGADFNEVQGAAALLRDHGSDQDLMRLVAIVRKYQTVDLKYYGVLWQYATESENPREVRVLAVVLADRRIASGTMRYCDYALGEFDRLTKEHFDIAAASIPERDASISRALAWIRAH
jgi:hypothetical protein